MDSLRLPTFVIDAHRQPGIPLHRQQHPIGNVVALDGVSQGVHVHRPGRRSPGFGPNCPKPVPTERDQHMIAPPGRHRHPPLPHTPRRAGTPLPAGHSPPPPHHPPPPHPPPPPP